MIADFGIALAVGVAGGGRLTETGLSVGTPHYMSPEQATGDQAVGVATDIYALGAVLYEMLVGEPPYTGSTAQAILGKIIQGKIASATEERASVPANVDAAIRKALEKLSADRFRGAQEFAGALADPGFRHGEVDEAAVVAGVGPRKRLTMATTTLAALFGAIGNVLGSWVAYYVGAWGGRPLVEKYGKYILISKHDLEMADRFFERWGNWAVFGSRLLPVVRTFISVPAGISRMPIVQFTLYTFAGAYIWSLGLAWGGFALGENWEDLRQVMRPFDFPIAGIIAVAVLWFIYHRIKAIRSEERD